MVVALLAVCSITTEGPTGPQEEKIKNKNATIKKLRNRIKRLQRYIRWLLKHVCRPLTIPCPMLERER